MRLIQTYCASPYRIYRVSRRAERGISTFMAKNSRDYLDYSVDFVRVMRQGERLVLGQITVQGKGLTVENVYTQGTLLTGFISGGMSNRSFYLVFQGVTDQGNCLVQEMVLPTFGAPCFGKKESYRFVSLSLDLPLPEGNAPLNGIRIGGRYLIGDNGFFMGI